jgi:hypothetical protein
VVARPPGIAKKDKQIANKLNREQPPSPTGSILNREFESTTGRKMSLARAYWERTPSASPTILLEAVDSVKTPGASRVNIVRLFKIPGEERGTFYFLGSWAGIEDVFLGISFECSRYFCWLHPPIVTGSHVSISSVGTSLIATA